MSDQEETVVAPTISGKAELATRPSFLNPKIYKEYDAKPKPAKVKKQKKKQSNKTEHGFMYIGHLPHGFYEEQCKSYFSQFGRVCKIKLSRSIKTGNHKGYGFIEFENEQVAKIAADTMNNYLMFNKLLKCHVISKEKLNKYTFKNAKKPFFLKLDSTFRKRFNAKKSEEKLKKIAIRNSLKMKKRQEKLNEAGIKLDLSKLLKKEETKKPEKSEESKTKEAPVKKAEAKKVAAPVEAKSKPAKKLKSKK